MAYVNYITPCLTHALHDETYFKSDQHDNISIIISTPLGTS